MKNCVLGFLLFTTITASAQEDTTRLPRGTSIIKIGNMNIIRVRPDSASADSLKGGQDTVKIGQDIVIVGKGIAEGLGKLGKAIGEVDLSRLGELKDMLVKKKPKKVSTNWLVFDIGFAGYNDKTNYSSNEAQSFMVNMPGSLPASKGDYALKGSRISNFNLWFFMQRASIIKNVVNLKYGFGIESNNYFFKTDVTYVDGTRPYTTRGTTEFSKNKLVANYLTVPLMINIHTNPSMKKKGLQFSAGISGGYLHSSRQKQKSAGGMEKNKTDFNLERLKLSYIAELGLGPLKLFGSVAAKPMHQYGLEQYPYTVGLRFSN